MHEWKLYHMSKVTGHTRSSHGRQIHFQACVCSHFSCVWFFVTLWTVAHQASLSMEFSRREYWTGLPCLLQGIFTTQGSNPCLLGFLHCRWIFYHWATWEIQIYFQWTTKPEVTPLFTLSPLGGVADANSWESLHSLTLGRVGWMGYISGL